MSSSETDPLEVPDDDAFQRREWTIQRIGWALWALLLVAAILGFLGPGLLSRTTALSGDGALGVEFDRFVHHHHPETIRILLLDPSSDTERRVWLSNAFLKRVEIQRIEPEPIACEICEDGVIYVFQMAEDARSGHVTVHWEPEGFGFLECAARLEGKAVAQWNQFVYP